MIAKRIEIFNWAVPIRKRGRQRGAALLILLVLLVVGVAAMLVNSLTTSAINTARQEKTAAALAQARDALIGYAVTYGDTHTAPPEVSGYLPCPDTSGSPEGSAASPCGSQDVSVVGRLPWRTLSLPILRDGNGECLWYAISGTYKNLPKNGLMNWDNNGQFQILAASGVTLTGQTSDSYAVAVIFASGVTLNGQSQNRSPDSTAPICGGNYTASNYLDRDTSISANNATPSTIANTISQFFTAGATTNINDQMIFITKQDIWKAIKKRNDFGSPLGFVAKLLSAATACLSSIPNPVTINFDTLNETIVTAAVGSLYVGRIPSSALTSCANNNLVERWQDNLLYATCTTASCLNVNGAGCNGIVIFSGERNTSQTRITNTDKNTWSNYLEDTPYANLTAFTTGGTVFSGASSYSAAATSTDILACIL